MEGLKADWHRVFAEAAKLDKAVKIDGYTDRRDLRVSFLKKARNLGDAEDMPGDSFAGHFSSKPSDDQTRQMGKKLLDAMGVKVSMLK